MRRDDDFGRLGNRSVGLKRCGARIFGERNPYRIRDLDRTSGEHEEI